MDHNCEYLNLYRTGTDKQQSVQRRGKHPSVSLMMLLIGLLAGYRKQWQPVSFIDHKSTIAATFGKCKSAVSLLTMNLNSHTFADGRS